jgi:hypothetical protein
MNENEQQLVVELGIYGCWLLRHAPEIGPECAAAQDIYKYYGMWSSRSSDHAAAMVLMDAIDEFIKLENYEPLKNSYPEALQDLNEFRRSSKKIMV